MISDNTINGEHRELSTTTNNYYKYQVTVTDHNSVIVYYYDNYDVAQATMTSKCMLIPNQYKIITYDI